MVLVLGIGNTLRTDDGVGIYVVRELRKLIDTEDNSSSRTLDIKETAASGLNLLDLLSGYDRAILVDAIITDHTPPGAIHRFSHTTLPARPSSVASGTDLHRLSLPEALELAKRWALPMPQEIIIYAMEAEDVLSLREECTPSVQFAVPQLVQTIAQELRLPGNRGYIDTQSKMA